MLLKPSFKVGVAETATAQLDITFGPAILKAMKDVEVVEGSRLVMACDVSGTPKPEFAWFKGEVPLSAGDKYQFEASGDSYSLVVASSAGEDTGLYRAVFTNEFGASETKANASVLIVPRFYFVFV